MAFKSVKVYNDEKFGGLFLLRNDGDYADVVFLYQKMDDVLVADTHYIKSADYSGYVHCTGRGCPACSKGIRVQTKLFIPLYNVTEGQVQFFDRTIRFEPQLEQDVFSKYPNPSEFVFRITRHGAAGDVNTHYQITAIGKNISTPYQTILSENSITFPDYYSNICKDVGAIDLQAMLNSDVNAYSSNSLPDYTPSPRAAVSFDAINNLPDVPVDTDINVPDNASPTSLSDDLPYPDF